MVLDKIVTDDDLIDFLLDQYKQTGNHLFLTAANGLDLYRRDCSFLNFCIDEQNKWISVVDRLPKNHQEVLVYRGHHSGLMNVYTYMGDNEWEDDYSQTAQIAQNDAIDPTTPHIKGEMEIYPYDIKTYTILNAYDGEWILSNNRAKIIQ